MASLKNNLLRVWHSRFGPYLTALGTSYGITWLILESLGVDKTFAAPALAGHRTTYLLLGSVLIAAHVALLKASADRWHLSAGRPTTPEELKQFHEDLRPLLDVISKQADPTKSERTRVLVSTTVATAARLRFGIPELATIALPAIHHFDRGALADCRICHAEGVELLPTGQCGRCKLHCASWLRLHVVRND